MADDTRPDSSGAGDGLLPPGLQAEVDNSIAAGLELLDRTQAWAADVSELLDRAEVCLAACGLTDAEHAAKARDAGLLGLYEILDAMAESAASVR